LSTVTLTLFPRRQAVNRINSRWRLVSAAIFSFFSLSL
jgi:hypothetical protein